jgi:GNAT superfamily N-acetyltransferase
MRLVRTDEVVTTERVKEVLRDYQTLVFDEGGTVVGLACLQPQGKGRYNLRMYTDPGARRRGVGRDLYAALESLLAEAPPTRVTAMYRAAADDARAFFARRGFGLWYAMNQLVYRGPGFPEPAVEVEPYEDRYFDRLIRLNSEAFYPVRKRLGLEPAAVYRRQNTAEYRAHLAERRGDIFVVHVSGNLIAGGIVDGEVIDTVAVAPKAQREGFGRALTQFCVNLILRRGKPAVRTSVVAGSVPPQNLYASLGFEVSCVYEWVSRRPVDLAK